MAEVNNTAPAYWFGPREKRGLVFGLRAGQLVVIGLGAFGMLVAVQTPGPVGPLIALVLIGSAGVAAWVPVRHLTLEQWVPVVAGHLWRVLLGQQHWRSVGHLRGHRQGQPLRRDLPRALRGLQILALRPALAEGTEMGFVKDRSQGAYVAALALQGRDFSLLGLQQQAMEVDVWSSVVASLGGHVSAIDRLQWLVRRIPEDGIAFATGLGSHGALHSYAEAHASYGELVASATAGAWRYESCLALRLDARRAGREVKQAGAPDGGAAMLLEQQLRRVEAALSGAQVEIAGHLTGRQVAAWIRYAYEPDLRQLRAAVEAAGGAGGMHPAQAWPSWSAESWHYYRTGGWWHVTYAVEEWPRSEVPPNFLEPLVLGGGTGIRTVSMTMDPLPPQEAEREVRRARVSDISEASLRAKHGQLTTARKEREEQHVLDVEHDLAEGHVSVRFAGYVTVSVPAPELLQEACLEVEGLAAQSRLLLSRLYGDQALGFTYSALPLCRGLG